MFVYALVDPLTREIKYVGRSVDPGARLMSHMSEPLGKRRAKWIRSVKRRRLRPRLIILNVCATSAEAAEMESRMIHEYRATVTNDLMVNRTTLSKVSTLTGNYYR